VLAPACYSSPGLLILCYCSHKNRCVKIDFGYFCSYASDMARPPIPPESRKTNVLRIRLTDEERDLLDRAAKGRTSTWARKALIKLARRSLSTEPNNGA
jgi:hypothetical protein